MYGHEAAWTFSRKTLSPWSFSFFVSLILFNLPCYLSTSISMISCVRGAGAWPLPIDSLSHSFSLFISLFSFLSLYFCSFLNLRTSILLMGILWAWSCLSMPSSSGGLRISRLSPFVLYRAVRPALVQYVCILYSIPSMIYRIGNARI